MRNTFERNSGKTLGKKLTIKISELTDTFGAPPECYPALPLSPGEGGGY